jgi:hypothetical protein
LTYHLEKSELHCGSRFSVRANVTRLRTRMRDICVFSLRAFGDHGRGSVDDQNAGRRRTWRSRADRWLFSWQQTPGFSDGTAFSACLQQCMTLPVCCLATSPMTQYRTYLHKKRPSKVDRRSHAFRRVPSNAGRRSRPLGRDQASVYRERGSLL